MDELLAVGAAWILDVVFFILLIGGTALGVKRGFIKSLMKLAGFFFAFIIAIFFCVSFAGFLDSAFGMTTAISDGLVGSLSDKDGFSLVISSEGLAEELTSVNVPGFIVNIIVNALSGAEIPEGTTVAMLVAPVIAKWISIAISFVLLLILVKLLAYIVGKIATSLINKFAPLKWVNSGLGGLLGLAKSIIVIFILLAICSWLPLPSLHGFISDSAVVGGIFNSDWFHNATSYAVSFQWFTDYFSKLFV